MDVTSNGISIGRFKKLSVILHWVMAFAIFGMLASGVAMEQDGLLEKSLKFKVYQWHKSLGVLLLLTLGFRIFWRLLFKAPKLPDFFHGVEKLAVKFGHIALYLLMFLMPLTGWLMVSSSSYGLPTIVFGWFEWPHIPWVESSEAVNKLSRKSHEIIGYVFMVVIAVHIAAVIKHIVVDKYNLLPRMWFGSLVFAIGVFTPLNPAQAASYAVDYTQSSVSFSGEHAGKAFEGEIGEWSADIAFDSQDLENSSIKAVFFPETMKTGDKIYDGTLPKKDWFDVKNHAEAVFVSEQIKATDKNGFYHIVGDLTIKGRSHTIEFIFSLNEETTQAVEVKASFSLNRILFGLGVQSDPNAEWVSENIDLQLTIVAAKQ